MTLVFDCDAESSVFGHHFPLDIAVGVVHRIRAGRLSTIPAIGDFSPHVVKEVDGFVASVRKRPVAGNACLVCKVCKHFAG